MTNSTNTALYATQGGGYATYVDGQYVWHSDIPEFLPNAQIGDPIPDEWSTVPINDEARSELDEYLDGVEDLFYDGYDAMTDFELS